jgi:GNAT superfamily N-acetyltransferase
MVQSNSGTQMKRQIKPTWATPTDHAELADVIFDAVHNGLSLYTEAQGTGLFRRLFNSVEAHARAAHEPRLWVHASLMAQPAFAAVGFSITEHQVVQIGDQDLKRAYMEKPL